MDITNAEFVISNTDVRKCPTGTFPEYAFIGRSNVGKSSLINMLTGRKGLAMTSATPGKTMLINHFLINKSWYIVDLPGYGYAKRGQKGQEQIKRIIESYILQREQIVLSVFFLIAYHLSLHIFSILLFLFVIYSHNIYDYLSLLTINCLQMLLHVYLL